MFLNVELLPKVYLNSSVKLPTSPIQAVILKWEVKNKWLKGEKKEQVEFKHVEIGEEGILDGETNVNKSLGSWEKTAKLWKQKS